ncbi:hypothetical protein [Hymenobacter sp. BRD67]|uniref:hypothetical protein n=1 Tax=Hymenobacter sp. BRD67 TaxID=2675877 RepID=UPI00156701FD|nr:hypothetical protein [Hymenobacter sp. BRD67]QKG51713.1 hypothetical protein GKZ67_02795 [Hymenobacter sp. BRD67]
MKKTQLYGRLLSALLLLLGWSSAAWAQVTVSPSYFTDSTPITLTFDATQGSAGLANYTGDVYIWTGVITDKSTNDTNWRFVVGNSYSTPIAAEKMTPVQGSPHKYTISFTPRTYYPGFASSGEVLKKLAMVFRAAGGSPEGKGPGGADILIGAGVQVAFTSPAAPNTQVAAGTSLLVAGTATAPSTLTLTLNGTQVAQQTNTTTFSTNVTISQQGINTLVLTAFDGTTTASATTTVIVAPPVTTAPLPAGAKADGITYINGGTSAILSLTARTKTLCTW